MRKEKEQELFKEQQQMRGRMADRLAKEYREIEVTKHSSFISTIMNLSFRIIPKNFSKKLKKKRI